MQNDNALRVSVLVLTVIAAACVPAAASGAARPVVLDVGAPCGSRAPLLAQASCGGGDRVFLDFTPFPDGEAISGGIALESARGADRNPYYRESLRLLNDNSYLEASFEVRGMPRDAALTLRHLSSASSEAYNGGWSPVSVYVNGSAVVRDHSPDEHGMMEETWDLGELLQPGRNTIRIQAEDLQTHYWVQRIEVAWRGGPMGPGPGHGPGPGPGHGPGPDGGQGPRSLYIDFSGVPDGPAEARGMDLTAAEGVDENPYYKQSLRLLADGSYVEVVFDAAYSGEYRELLLRHLSSAASEAYNGGWSPVNVYVNGYAVASDHSPDSHGFIDEAWDISGMVQQGRNVVRIEAGDLQTHYWVQRVEVGR